MSLSRRSVLGLLLVAALLVLPAMALAVAGDFGEPSSSPEAAGKIPSSVAAGNFNGDTHGDLVVTNKDDGNMTVLLGDGTGDFSAAGSSPEAVGGAPWRVATGHFDGDADTDLAVVLHEDKVAILLGDGNGDFASTGTSPVTVGGSPRNLAVADLDGDADEDIAVANFFPATVSILLNDGDGNFSVASLNAGGSATNASSIAAADFNGDTEVDLAVGAEFSNEMRVYLNDADEGAVFTMREPVETGFDAGSMTAGKFDADADVDLAAADGSATKTVAILLNDGNGDFAPAPTSPESLPVVSFSILAAELNGDSKLDLVGTGGISGPGVVPILLGGGNGDFSPAPSSPETAGILPTWAAAANFGGSPATDLAIANTNSGNVTILLNELTAGTNPGGGGTGGGSTPSTNPPAVLPPPGQVKPPGTKACGKGKVRRGGKCVAKCPKKKTLKKGKCVKKKKGRKPGR